MALKEFAVAAKSAPESVIEGAKPLPIKVGDSEWTLLPPTPGQMAMVMASQGGRADEADRVAGFVDFLYSILSTKEANEMRDRLMDRDDPFEWDTVEEIVAWAMEEWTARPTGKSSAST